MGAQGSGAKFTYRWDRVKDWDFKRPGAWRDAAKQASVKGRIPTKQACFNERRRRHREARKA